MNVLPDTPIWSLAFRRRKRSPTDQILVDELTELILEPPAVMIGPVRQEILSEITHASQFDKVKKRLEAFDDLTINTDDYERAAQLSNMCRGKGIQGSHIDFLICAVAERHDTSIFTTDDDFNQYAEHIPVTLHNARMG